MVVVAQQNRVTPSPSLQSLEFRLGLRLGLLTWTLDLDFGLWNWTLELDFGIGLWTQTWTWIVTIQTNTIFLTFSCIMSLD